MSLVSQAATAVAVRRSKNVVSRIVADEAIVVPVRRGAADMDSIYTFNATGSLLWSLIEGGRSGLVELAKHLQEEYGISAEQASADTERFLAELSEAGLIETV